MASWGWLEHILILRSNSGAFSALKLELQIDEQFLLGAMLVQDDPKDHIGWILDPIVDRFLVLQSIGGGGGKIRCFLAVCFFNDFVAILGYPLGYHFGVNSIRTRC